MVRFYCQCLTTHHENDATAVLDWLRHEVDTAEIRIFHEFVFPFLLKLHGAMQDCSLSVSATQQEACQYMVLAFLNRCVGMEPAKPSTWTRSIRGCRDAACLLCPKLHEFLQNPEMEIGYLEDGPGPYGWSSWNKGHLYDQTSWWHESTPHHKMGDGSEMLRIKKLDKEWADTHDAWKRRYGKVTDALKHGLIPSRPLLGEKYEELVKMRPIKISTGK